ncbi:alpha/beta hydrolase fold domain-containing protein [bacterium]|nr:alpha/beta hydrolase fold domain-containing protein [bacterium]
MGIPYAEVDGQRLLFDLYLPESGEAASGRKWPVVVWVHGGAWRAGDRSRVPVQPLTRHGFVVASVDYRLSPVARFPAQVYDIKAAIRFLRANATTYGLDTERFAIAGASAGGHLAALTGVSGQELEGEVGDHRDQPSAVSAIVSFYGASNLQTILSQSTPHGLSVRVPALQLLLGGQPDEKPDLARLASPVAHVDGNDPPLLLIHGDQDPQMPINQAHELHGAYLKLKRPVEFDVVYGAAHGGDAFYTDAMIDRVARFLSRHLKCGR